MTGPVRASSRGVTLVEILVAAAIISLSVISVVAFVRKGQEQVALDKHRRTARSIVERTIEDPQYDMFNYPNLVSGAVTRTDTIDGRYTPPLTGTLTVLVGDEQTITADGAGAVVVPYRSVSVTLTWTEVDCASPETVSAEKWVTNGANR